MSLRILAIFSIYYTLVQKDKATSKNAEIWIDPLFSFKNSYFYNVFSNKIIYWKSFEKSFSLIIILENIKISMMQKDKATYEFIK